MSCMYAGSEYSEGSLICANGRELVCDGGSWRENGYMCGEGNGTRQIQQLSLVALEASEQTTGSTRAAAITQIAASKCMVFTAAAGGFRMYNSCTECKIAVLFMTDNKLNQERREVRLAAKADIFIDMRGYYKVDYVDDLDCPKTE